MTIRHTGCKLHPVWRVVICGDESFESSWIVSIWQHRQPPFTDTCGIFSKSLTNWLPVCVSKCLANRRYDGSFDSSRFDNIFNLLSQTLAEYFLSLLQIDFRYAFPCFKRWFLTWEDTQGLHCKYPGELHTIPYNKIIRNCMELF